MEFKGALKKAFGLCIWGVAVLEQLEHLDFLVTVRSDPDHWIRDYASSIAEAIHGYDWLTPVMVLVGIALLVPDGLWASAWGRLSRQLQGSEAEGNPEAGLVGEIREGYRDPRWSDIDGMFF